MCAVSCGEPTCGDGPVAAVVEGGADGAVPGVSVTPNDRLGHCGGGAVVDVHVGGAPSQFERASGAVDEPALRFDAIVVCKTQAVVERGSNPRVDTC